MDILAGAFDITAAALLLWLAWRVLTGPDLFRAVVLFIVFGLVLALVWARLDAPDIALAEAAIGAGFTGVLLFDALGHLGGDKGSRVSTTRTIRVIRVVPAAALAVILAWAVFDLPTAVAPLAAIVAARVAESGVSYPVTAVLLNFRGYDTLLEIAVLLMAVIGVWSLRLAPAPDAVPSAPPLPALRALVQVLLPLMIVSALYLLWRGSHAPGGAFQAGAILGALVVLLLLAQLSRVLPDADQAWTRFALSVGFAVFLLMAAGAPAFSRQLLAYPPAFAGELILLIEATLTVSIGAILALLFAGAPSHRPGGER